MGRALSLNSSPSPRTSPRPAPTPRTSAAAVLSGRSEDQSGHGEPWGKQCGGITPRQVCVGTLPLVR
jgi:hypothetical protein